MALNRRELFRRLCLGACGAVGGCSMLTSGYPALSAHLYPNKFNIRQKEANFGQSISASTGGNTLLVGAVSNSDHWTTEVGSAYVISDDGGHWHQTANLIPTDGEGQDYIGDPVDLSDDGTTAILGVRDDDNSNGRQAGSAYVFSQNGESWMQQSKLIPLDGDRRDKFGYSVALSENGDTALIGAHHDEDPSGTLSGSVYSFSRTNGSWEQQSKLIPNASDRNDAFGWSLDLTNDGSLALVSGINDEYGDGPLVGSVVVFSRSGSNWSEVSRFTSPRRYSSDGFGWSVAISGDGETAVIGERGFEVENAYQLGRVHIYNRNGGDWKHAGELPLERIEVSPEFGQTVDISGKGNTVLVGDTGVSRISGRKGSAHVFTLDDKSWTKTATLTPRNGKKLKTFGLDVALSEGGSMAIVSEITSRVQDSEVTGSVYVFNL